MRFVDLEDLRQNAQAVDNLDNWITADPDRPDMDPKAVPIIQLSKLSSVPACEKTTPVPVPDDVRRFIEAVVLSYFQHGGDPGRRNEYRRNASALCRGLDPADPLVAELVRIYLDADGDIPAVPRRDVEPQGLLWAAWWACVEHRRKRRR